MSVSTIYSDKEMVKFIDSSTADDLKDYFKEENTFHDVNKVMSVDVHGGLSFLGSPLAYALFSDKTSASHVQALIDCGAKLDDLKPLLLEYYGPDMDDHTQVSYNPFEEASADKVEVITRAVAERDQWINRKYSDAEIYDLITSDNSSGISDYFGRHDPNEEITWEYPEKNLRYVGSICGLAAFDEKVNVYSGFVQILDKGGDPNVLCRVENIDNPENVDVLTVTELCHSADKIRRALEYGGLPTQHLLEDVLYGIKHRSANELRNIAQVFRSDVQISPEQLRGDLHRHSEASNNLRLVLPLELKLVTDHPEIFEAHHMHGMANPQAVTEMLLMGHDPGVVNEDGQSLMLSSLLNGRFEVFDVLQRFGVESGAEGERPMDLVVKHFDCVREAHVPGSGDFEDWQRCERAIAHLVQNSEDPTADLASYLKIGRFPDAHEVAQLIDRGAVMSDEAQRKYMSDETYAVGDEKEKVQQALNRQQRDVILTEVGEVYTPPTMRRKM